MNTQKAVSYTHLDVYKRQTFSLPRSFKSSGASQEELTEKCTVYNDVSRLSVVLRVRIKDSMAQESRVHSFVEPD